MEKEISAIDAIYQILEKIDYLDKKVQAIDDNVKLLNNKLTKLNKNVTQEVTRPTAVAVGMPQAQASIEEPQQSTREPEKLLLGSVKTYGYLINRMKEPVMDVVVNIYDSSNKLVKSNKTNNDGYWESRLPSGKFNIEYIHSKFKPINKEIEVPKNVKEYEVR
jgi:hypothetical protein